MSYSIQLIDIRCAEFPPATIDTHGPAIIAPTKAQAIMGVTETLLGARNVVALGMAESKTHVRIVGLDSSNTVIIGYLITAA